MAGQWVCRMHGGSAPQVRAKAEERQVEARADAEIRALWPGLAEATAITDPIDLLARTAGALEQMAETVGARVNELKGIAGGEHLQLLRGEVVLLDRILDKLLKAGEGMARLGIAERQIQLDQQLAELVVGAFRAALAEVTLLPDDRARLLEVYLERLGMSSDVVAGEVVA
jgi:hypothetical protein